MALMIMSTLNNFNTNKINKANADVAAETKRVNDINVAKRAASEAQAEQTRVVVEQGTQLVTAIANSDESDIVTWIIAICLTVGLMVAFL